MSKKLFSIILIIASLCLLVGCDDNVVDEEVYVTVSFITNADITISSQSVLAGTKIEEPSIEKDGYDFMGWFLESNEDTQWNFDTDVVEQDMTLWAKWIEKTIDTMTTEEMLVKLNQSIYQDELNVDDTNGLSDASSVGVNLEQLENEIRYPVPELSTFDNVFYVNNYGLSPQSEDNTNAFRLLLLEVKDAEGSKIILFDQGQYKFVETITMMDIDNLYITGYETEWLMRSWQTIMKFDNCEEIHINNINFDYEISPTISGTIVSTDEETSTVSVLVDDEFDLTNFRYNGGYINYGNYMEYVFDDFSDAYIPDANGMLRYNSTGDNVRGISSSSYDDNTGILTLTFNAIQGAFKAPEIGKVVSVGFTMYEYEGFLIKETKNFYMETVNIYTTPGMAIRSESSENLYFNRTNLMLKPGSKRLMTATADGLHAADTVGDIIVSNSIFEYSHDDSINIKTFYFKVDSVLRNKVTLNMTTTEVRIPINVGDQLEFFEDNTFSSKAIRTVTAVEAYGTTYEITLNENLSTGLVNQGDLVGNISRVPKVSIENSIFRNKRNRGILVQVRDSRIINSAFYNIIHGPIMVHAAFDVFAEAIVPQNITIQNCKFINNNQASGLNGDISVFRYGGEIVSNTIKQITISNNYFYHSAYRAIYLLGTGDVIITNNLFQDVAINVSGDSGKNNAIYIKTCIDTTITDNLIYMTNDKAYFMFLYATDDVNTITSNNLNRNKENE